MRRISSLASTLSSMKLLRAAEVNTLGSTAFGIGDVIRLTATRLPYKTVIAASPCPATRILPELSTVATRSSLLLNLAQRVTSSACPSLYQARTIIGIWSSGFKTAACGNTSSF